MSEQAPAGWYPDGQGNDRYWDGAAWTESVRTTTPPAERGTKRIGAFGKLGAVVKQSVADRQAAKDAADNQFAADATEAGPLVTSGVFGSSTVEIYQGGYVRVRIGTENHGTALGITKRNPYEKLRSITFTPSESETAKTAKSSALEGAVDTVMGTLIKGGSGMLKSSVPGLAAAGIAHVASTGSRRAFLIVTTDKAIHTLSNQVSGSFVKTASKAHSEVARGLVAAANAVLAGVDPSALPTASESPMPGVASATETPTSAATAKAPTLADRIRELADLHKEGILSDEEFADSKARLLSGL